MVFSNIVRKGEMREVQLKALKEISEALTMSFGPMGSNTLIIKDGACNRYTKDGYSILKELKLTGSIEHSIVEDLVDITRGIVKELGDNTTGAVIMSYLLFKEMTDLESKEKELPFVIIENFKKAVALVSQKISEQARECTLDDIYDIAFTSTNGNSDIATKMKNIYTEYGMDVFIDVNVSITGEDLIKEYDGMTIDAGYADQAFVTNKAKDVSTVRNARVYVFNDPVDTPEMMSFFDAIIHHNIYEPWKANRQDEVIPTVIMATKISRDLSAYMTNLIEFMYHTPESQRPPLLIITNIVQEEQFKDIARMCNAKLIKKYISNDQQKKDIELGLAPTIATVHTFCGYAEEVESSMSKSKFVNPIGMDDTEDYVLNSGCFEEVLKEETKELENPKVYTFSNEASVDFCTGKVSSIIYENIIDHLDTPDSIIPTVIIIPANIELGINDRLSEVIDTLGDLPLIMIEATDSMNNIASITNICNGKFITDDDEDVVAGTAERVVSTENKTKFVHPEGSKDSNGNYTSNYASLVQFLEGQVRCAYEDGQDAGFIGGLKRRLNSLKGNMVEFLVGGVSASDRDSVRDLVEDAVLNCRSSALNGVGHGANFEGLRAANQILLSGDVPDELKKYVEALCNAYVEVTELLYTSVHDVETAKDLIAHSLEVGIPYNLRSRNFDGLVLTSIKSDEVTLSTIAKILGLMITCNQALLQNPLVNTYYSKERTEEGLGTNFSMDQPIK